MRSRWLRATVVSAVALGLLVGLAAAPAAAQSDEDGDEGPFPEEICYDITGEVNENVPYDQLIWVDDLPEELQPPGVPWNVVTPRAVAGIVFGFAPNQCEVWDPNDPPFDPTDPPDDPNAGYHVEDGDRSALIFVNGTLDQSEEGPSASAGGYGEAGEAGDLDPYVAVNDGEKDYALDPRFRYWDDGTIYPEVDVWILKKRAGLALNCFSEECEPEVRGVATFVDPPTFPSPGDGEDPREDADGDADADSDDGGNDETDGTAGSSAETDDAGGDGAADDDGGDADTESDADADGSDADGGEAAGDEDDAASDDPETDTDDESDGDDAGGTAAADTGEDPSEAGFQAGGGLGAAAGVAALSLLGLWAARVV